MARDLRSNLPMGWESYSPNQKISYFNAIGATPQELFAADPTLTQEGIDWMRSQGYTVGILPPVVPPPVVPPPVVPPPVVPPPVVPPPVVPPPVVPPPIVFPSNIKSLTPIEKQTFYRNLLNQGYTDAQIRAAADSQLGVQSDESWNLLTGQTIIGDTQTLTPSPLSGTDESRIDPVIAPYLQEALGVARNLFLQGQGPQMYPGQMYVSPSAQTLQALTQAERIATSPEAQALSTQGLQAYQGALGGLSSIARGDYLQSPGYQRYLESVTRPVTEAVTEQILPSIASQYSAAGRYGSGAMQQATGKATELGTRALGDITAQVAQQQQGRMLEAQTALPSFLGSMPQVLGGALAPSTTLAGVGAQREAIAGQPLQEAIRRFEYGQQLPYSQLSGYLSSIYGSPLGSLTQQQQQQGNTTLQNIGGLLGAAALIPNAISGIQSGISGFRSGLEFLGGLRY